MARGSLVPRDMDSLFSDLRYAVRALRRNPTFTLAAVACFALGIGANATMFGVVDALMFRPPALVRNPGRVVRLYFTQTSSVSGRSMQASTSYLNFTDIRDGVPAFAQVAAFTPAVSLDAGRGVAASRVRVSAVSASYFELVGVRPALGRFFSADADRMNGPLVAVLGYEYWRRRFSGDSAAVGRAVQIGNALYTVIGVAAEGFHGVDLQPVDLWLPLAAAGAVTAQSGSEWFTNRNWSWVAPLARLRDRATAGQAAAQATVVFRRGDAVNDPSAAVAVGPIEAARGPEASTDARLALWLAAVSALVLLIACANVANLLLARAMRRRREVASRLALGAGRWRLGRQLLTESLALSALGGVAALLVAAWATPVLHAYVLPKDAVAGPLLDLRVLAFTALVALLTGLASGLVPALQASRHDLAGALKAGEREGRYQRSNTRAGLLVAQTSLTLVLLAGTGLFLRSLRNALRLDVGFEAQRVIVADVNVLTLGYTRARVDDLFRRLMERAASVPGVERAAVSLGGPFGWAFGRKVRLPGRDTLQTPAGGGPYINAVTPDFFGTIGTPIARGRGFTATDREGTAKVAVLGQAMARWLWPNGDPLGRCIILSRDSTCTVVVGVAADVLQYALTEKTRMQYYVPLGQVDNGHRTLWIRTRGDPHLVAGNVQRALTGVAPDLPYVSVRPLEDLVEPEYRPWRLGATVFGLFGGLALALAALGLYGVLAYTVAQRTQELGVRIALGAVPRDVFALVVRQGLAVAGIGVGLGVVLALAAGRILSSLLYGVSPRDPLVLAASAALLLAAAAVASWLPARRAAKVDPVVALRSE